MKIKIISLSLILLTSTTMQALARFNKTHFVLNNGSVYKPYLSKPTGIKSNSVRSYATKKKQSADAYVFFSPDDDVRSVLIGMIEQEKKSIKLAIFTFTEKRLAHALCAAKKRGVDVQVITDPSCLSMKSNKIGDLCRSQIPVFVYNAENTQTGWKSLMHHKYVVFECNTFGKPCVATGSFNWTRAAGQGNQENLVVIEDSRVVKKFEEQFQVLKRRSQENISAKKMS